MASAAQSITSAPLPPLPNLQSASGTGGAPLGNQDALSAIVSGIAPVKSDVDGIISSARRIVASGAVPGSEQLCAQIIALATQLLPMALQQALQPGQGAPPAGNIPAIGGGGPPTPPAPGGAAPAGAQ